ncbi:MAG: hypothetical protein K2G30_04150 [Muribaculaceae bacterium]|nr:hypothetical protein [Muribaculaceae bacterium]
MRKALKYTFIWLAALPVGAVAQSFLPYGGADGNSHFVIEPFAAGYAATDDAVLSHGALPAVSTFTSGVSQVVSDGGGISVRSSADGRELSLEGLDADCRYEIFAVDGRLVAAGRSAASRIGISGLSGGRYLLRITTDAAASSVHHFQKRL